MKKLLALIPVLALVLPAAAQAADPFGHPCTAQNGVRFCPTATDAQRVPSWDGVPLDVQAAHAVGCTAIAVATGHFDAAALREAGADHFVQTMEQPLPLG